MAVTDRAAESIGGPRGGTTWYDEGMAGSFFAKTAVTVGAAGNTENILFIVPQPNTIVMGTSTSSVRYTDVVGYGAAGEPIQAVYGVTIAADVAIAAAIASITFDFRLYRAGALVGGGAFAGWAAAGNPAFPAFTPVAVPFLTANTALQPGPSGTVGPTFGTAFLPVQPLDVITTRVSNSSVGGIAINPFTVALTLL